MVAALAVAFPSAVAAAPGLRLGFADGQAFTALPQDQLMVNLAHARAAGSSVIRFSVSWNSVAPTRPPTAASAADPGWQGYRWGAVDQYVRNVEAAGMQPLAIVNTAPAWAEGSHRPTRARMGTWKPSASALGAFAHALAVRYSGAHPDPLHPGAMLPAVRYWQVWNEPNITIFLAPQWTRLKHGYAPNSPGLYRKMLNAFYEGVKSVSRQNYVVTAGTAPFGDPVGKQRMHPAQFWRSLFCVVGATKPKSSRCRTPVYFDAVAHHPYTVGPPDHKALHRDDISVPDLKKITRPLAVAVKAGTVRPRAKKGLWVTEIAWDSYPDPDGLSLSKQATYLESSFYRLWKQGVSVITWYLLRDEAPDPSYALSRQTGVYRRGSTPGRDTRKPSFKAFRFPFTAFRSAGAAQIWGLVPESGHRLAVTIERQSGRRWVTVTRLHSGLNRVFSGRVRIGPRVRLRARTVHDTSLAWTTS